MSIKNALKQLNLQVNDRQINLWHQYIDLLEKWNKAYNLTAIRNKDQMYSHHLYDSLSIAPFIQGKKIMDVGSGGGFPGIPLCILYPEKEFILLDSNIKKSRFQTQAKIELKLDNLEVVHHRVELYQPSFRIDHVVSRAFTSLEQMLKWCLHLTDKKGNFLAMKGQYPEEEIKEIKKIYPNYQIDIKNINVPELKSQRHLVIIHSN